MINWIKRVFRILFGIEDADPKDEVDRRNQRSDTPEDIAPELSPVHSVDEVISPKLWYPKRVQDKELSSLYMKTRGYYQGGFPKGAVVHYTAGRSRDKISGGSRNANTNYEQGIREVKYGCNSPFCYFLIDADGNVHQQFPLDRWGYHAGKSSYPKIGKNVSTSLVGIEVMCAGRLEYESEGKCKAWFTNTKKGDKLFYEHEYNFWNKNKNIQTGFYHKFTDKQKEALVDLILWMNDQSKDFDLKKVLGHDEVAPNRKNDPGGSLGMPMEDFREMLLDIKKVEQK